MLSSSLDEEAQAAGTPSRPVADAPLSEWEEHFYKALLRRRANHDQVDPELEILDLGGDRECWSSGG